MDLTPFQEIALAALFIMCLLGFGCILAASKFPQEEQHEAEKVIARDTRNGKLL